MPGTVHTYVVNALVELPAYGRYAAGGRATRSGEISADQPLTETQLKQLIAAEVAKGKGFEPTGITFIEFAYTDLSA